MAATIYLRVPINGQNFKRVKLENINLDSKVDTFKDEAAKHVQLQKQGIDLIYCGIVLDDDVSLSASGIKPGVMIHVLEKKEPEGPIPARTMTEDDVQHLVEAFHRFSHFMGYRAVLHRLQRPEVLENIIATTPGLMDDPVALAIIQDPELIVHLSEPDTVKRIVEHHPSLAEAANHIAAVAQEEAKTMTTNQPGPSSGYSYSLDALSDDEDMESSGSDGGPQPLSRNTSYSAITAAQLAAAIANATGTGGNGGGYGTPRTPQQSSIITSEMFSNAIQQAFATTSSAPTTPAPRGAMEQEEEESMEQLTARYQSQLQQMHEMGLANDTVNVRALQATGGDVQAAIDLVFSGIIM